MQPLPMSFFDGLTGYFPEGEVFAYGSARKPKTVRKNGTKVYTFIDKSGKKADGVTHHLIQRPDGKYILKVDDGDHRNDRDDISPLQGGERLWEQEEVVKQKEKQIFSWSGMVVIMAVTFCVFQTTGVWVVPALTAEASVRRHSSLKALMQPRFNKDLSPQLV